MRFRPISIFVIFLFHLLPVELAKAAVVHCLLQLLPRIQVARSVIVLPGRQDCKTPPFQLKLFMLPSSRSPSEATHTETGGGINGNSSSPLSLPSRVSTTAQPSLPIEKYLSFIMEIRPDSKWNFIKISRRGRHSFSYSDQDCLECNKTLLRWTTNKLL